GNGEENLRTNVGREERQDEEDEEEELYRDVNINLGMGVQMADVHMNQEFKDSHVTLTPTPTSVAPLPVSVPTLTPSTIATTLEANFSEFMQTNQFTGAVFLILMIVQRYMDQQMNEAVKVAVQIQSDRLHDEAQAKNDEFLKTVDENMQKIIKEQTSYAVAANLSKMELKKILIEKMEGNKCIHQSNEQRNLYKALVEAYESDKIILNIYGGTVRLKRRRDDADKKEEPSAGSDRGSAGKSTQRSKSRQTSTSESATVEEPMQTTHEMEEPSHLEFETGADDQPIAEPSQHPECELAKQSDSRSSFNELMDTPVDFFASLMNRLKVDTLTPELLAGPTYELMKGSCKSQQYPHNMLKPLPLIPNSRGRRVIPFDHFINNDLEYLRGGASSRKYTTYVTKTKAADYGHIKWIKDLVPQTISIVIQRRVEDLQLNAKIYQKKLNLTSPDSYRSDLKRKEAYIAYSNPRGFIYQNKYKQNRLIRIDELYKFSDGTLTDVRTALDDRLKGIRMQYLPQTIWRKSDNDKAAAMIQAIYKQLKTRRIIRSLERFVGGRLYEGDFRMLQRTI
nr:hypothetical protein [Tanacetum cinerariifolium]